MVKNVQDQRADKKETLTNALRFSLGERVVERAGGGEPLGEIERKEEEGEVEGEHEREGGPGGL